MVALNSFSKNITLALGTALLTAISFTVVNGEAQKDFKLSCQSWFLNGTTFTAFCNSPSGGFGVQSSLDLNRCIANFNGILVCAQNGFYSQSCRNCAVTPPPGSVLSCECQEVFSGPFIPASFDLNTCVSDLNGSLACP